MKGADRIVSRSVLGFIAPVALMLAGWWGTYLSGGADPAIAAMALAGLAVGLALDATVLRRRLDSLFSMTDRSLMAVALFYSAGIFGMFMGFPLFNTVVGIFGGYVVAKRAEMMDWSRERGMRDTRKGAAFTTMVLAALCGATAYLALRDPTLGTQLRGMFGLPFEVTLPMIYALIAVGGTALLVFQYAGAIVAGQWFTDNRR